MPRRLATLLAALALFVLAIPGFAHAADRLDTGIQDPMDPKFGETDPDSVYSTVRRLGARVVRVPVSWHDIAPSAPQAASDPDDPAYDWRALDGRLAAIETAGLEPLVVLYGPPGWARVRVNGKRVLAPVPARFAAFATAAARRYDGTNLLRGRVRYWQIWNESNLETYFSADHSPQRYRATVNAAYGAIHAVRADNVVVAGGLSPFGGFHAISPMSYMRAMLCMSTNSKPDPSCHARSSFDVWAHHPYTSGGATHKADSPEDASMGDLPRMRALLLAAQRGHRIRSHGRVGFWVTEFSWETKPPDPRGVPPRLHARWVAEALYRMWQNDVTLAVWFQLRDIPRFRTDWGPIGQGGLFYKTTELYANEREKPAALAFRFPFVAVPRRGTTTVWGRTPDSRSQSVVVERRTSGGWSRVTRVRSNRHGIFRVRLRGAYGDVLRARAGHSLSLAYRAVPSFDLAITPFGGQP
ncbi:MAG TPA: hypothetical protein VK486_16150 [Thermoleophilaceae bacterium]|nr:hypothetical protein [Thermoleophilaceae bacterium]